MVTDERISAPAGTRSIALYLAIAFGMAWSCWLVAWLASHGRTSVPA